MEQQVLEYLKHLLKLQLKSWEKTPKLWRACLLETNPQSITDRGLFDKKIDDFIALVTHI